MRYTVVCAATALLALGLFSAASGAPSFTGLGDLAGGANYSEAWDVSADGTTVVGYSVSASGPEAFRWTSSTGMVGLGDLPDAPFNSNARAVSADGSVAVGNGFIAPATPQAMRWTSSTGMVGLGSANPSDAFGVTPDGNVIVGGMTTAAGFEAFRWTASDGMVNLGDLAGGDVFAFATDVSSDGGTVVGIASPGGSTRAFRWTAGSGMIGISGMDAANAVSGDGSTIVGGNASQALRWTSGDGVQNLGSLGGSGQSAADDVSGDGSVVVGFSPTATAPQEAFLWTEADGMRLLKELLEDDYGLDLTGWLLGEALAISPDGKVIAGWGINPNGDREAWIADLRADVAAAPEPATIAVMVVGLIGLATARIRR